MLPSALPFHHPLANVGPFASFLEYIYHLQLKASNLTVKFALEKYHSEGVTNDEKISARLQKECDIKMRFSNIWHFLRSCLHFEASSRGAWFTELSLCYEEFYQKKAQLILDVLKLDHANSSGPGIENVKARIAKITLIYLPRDSVLDVIHIFAPDGFAAREPGSHRILRVSKAPIGIHERWAADGHNRLNEIGFPIWATVDDATSKWLGTWVVPNNRVGNIVPYFFLVVVEEWHSEFLCQAYHYSSHRTVGLKLLLYMFGKGTKVGLLFVLK